MAEPPFARICVVGLGYIGLPVAALLASRGMEVIGVDINQNAVDTINRGEIHIVEPDLDIVVRSAVQIGRLKATLKAEPADAFLIAVPTPFTEGHKPDTSYIKAAAELIAPVLEKGNLVILESTSPVGTTEQLVGWLADLRPDLKMPKQSGKGADIHVAHCPERVLPGHILNELINNDRVVGGISSECGQAAAQLYKTFVRGGCHITNARTAELSKLTENACRDVNIAFANELSLICDRLEINVWEVIELANRHPRINILQPGPGVGGHCIAVDPWFIIDAAPEEARLIRMAREVNDGKSQWVVSKIVSKAERFKEPVIGCLGLAFKANIDDLRESPALAITRELIKKKVGRIMACEPNARPDFNEFPLSTTAEIIREADILVVLVDHDEFKTIDHETFKEKVLIDTRGIWR